MFAPMSVCLSFSILKILLMYLDETFSNDSLRDKEQLIRFW